MGRSPSEISSCVLAPVTRAHFPLTNVRCGMQGNIARVEMLPNRIRSRDNREADATFLPNSTAARYVYWPINRPIDN